MDKNDKQLLALSAACFTVAIGLTVVKKVQERKLQAEVEERVRRHEIMMESLNNLNGALDRAITNAKFWLLVTQDEEE